VRIDIAPNFSCDDWDTLKAKLDPSGNWASSPNDWEQAVKILETRIKRRFLEPAKSLEGNAYAGFAILALDCLLIESIQAFRRGKNAKNSAESRKAHTTFLTTTPKFSDFFSDALANDFYTSVRNGLLHDGETRKGWLVKANNKYALVDPQPKNFVVVNRLKFHAALVSEFESYLQSLRDPAEITLRKNLVKALNNLCTRSKP